MSRPTTAMWKIGRSLAVNLPQAVAPGATVAVEVAWTAHVPRTFRRTGVIGNYYFLSQWFPKLGVLEEAGWNTHQFHTDDGVLLGLRRLRRAADGPQRLDRRRHRRRAIDDGHASRKDRAPVRPGGRARLRLDDRAPICSARPRGSNIPGCPPWISGCCSSPSTRTRPSAISLATKATLRSYGEWFGPYPYGHLTIVDPAWQSEAGGMEYPTLFTGGSRWLAPRDNGDARRRDRARVRPPVLVRPRRQQRVRARVDGRRPQHVLDRPRDRGVVQPELPVDGVLRRLHPVGLSRRARGHARSTAIGWRAIARRPAATCPRRRRGATTPPPAGR